MSSDFAEIFAGGGITGPAIGLNGPACSLQSGHETIVLDAT